MFPWEGTELAEDAENTVTRMLQQIGEDPNRPELEDTPRQVVQCWDDLFSGYRYGDSVAGLLDYDPAPAPSKFGRNGDGMFVFPDIPFISTCENHLLPFFGAADVACLATERTNSLSFRGRVRVGDSPALGNVPRLVDVLARRLQTQQRLTEQICHALAHKTEGAAVRLKGTYLCPMAQGLAMRQSIVETTAFSGGFRPDPELQSRFLSQLP